MAFKRIQVMDLDQLFLRWHASYTSFKRFVREHAHELGVAPAPATTCRFESEPGEELQVDYDKMGRLYDSGRATIMRSSPRSLIAG